MLRSLSVENYALIDRLEMTLGPGLNIVTGETGAGKSILLGALGLLLGTRGEGGVQKNPERACVVEGVFVLDGYGLEPWFEEMDLEFASETTVRRVISAAGKSRAWVNDLPVSLGVLKDLTDRLIDIHSQHENLLLRDDGFRMSILDATADNGALVRRCGEAFAAWRGLRNELSEARQNASAARRDEEWLRHQTAELESMRLRAGEQEELESEERELSHADEIKEAFGQVAGELGDDDGGMVPRLKALRSTLERVKKLHPEAGVFLERLTSSHLELRELERDVAGACEQIESNPQRLEKVLARLDAIYRLQQKHRVNSVGELLELQADLSAQLASIDNFDTHIASLEQEVAAAESRVAEVARQIGEARREAAVEVERDVVATLKKLEMAEVRFVVEISPAAELRPNGADEVRFLFSSNAAMPPRPIEKIASGGEISRVMLALKALSARAGGQPTVIFDEIDAGVSGRIADAMGEVIAHLARHSQIVNITHLPQIASKPGSHFLVYKESGSTLIRPLSHDERVEEIAKMLSGNTVTDAALQHARELLGA